MQSVNWDQLKQIFDRAMELTGTARTAFLDEACHGDAGLRSEIEDLLEAYEAADDFLSDHNSQVEVDIKLPQAPGLPVVDRYRVCEAIGEGGFGTVYRAEQLEPIRRVVALKVIRTDGASDAIVKRFEMERQTLALMDHPNIARVLDAGETQSGSPFFVMELIDGKQITQFCDDSRLSIAARLKLFGEVCAGVQHAHQKGIIHRDIKPSNVLVADDDQHIIPKVIDFGVAKALQPELAAPQLTAQQQIVGTPAYMSPEQAAATPDRIDTRSDVYSLGVLLYELLTGTTPFDSQSLRRGGMGEMIRIIQSVDPDRPSTRVGKSSSSIVNKGSSESDINRNASSEFATARSTDVLTLQRQLQTDLDWIVMKCLEKDPERRYASAAALSNDIQRYLEDQPIEARPPSVSYRVRKFVRRNTATVVVSTALLLALVVSAIMSTVGFLQAQRAQMQAENAERSAKAVTKYLSGMLSEASPNKLGPEATLGDILDKRDDDLEAEFADQPLVEAEVRLTIGDAYSGMGWFEKGAGHLTRAVELYEMELGDSNKETLVAKVRLGANLRGSGKYNEAEKLLRDVISHYHENGSESLRNRITAEFELATLLRVQGSKIEAGRLSESVFEEAQREFGPNDELTLSAQQNLASFYDITDRRDEARTLLTDALQIQVESLGPTHPDTLLTRFNLAIKACVEGNHNESAEAYPELLSDYKSRLGDEHRMTNAVRSYFAFELAHIGKLPEADALITSTLAAQQSALSPTHRDVIESLRHAIFIKESLGKLDDAISLGEQRLAALTAIHGKLDKTTLTEMINMGANYIAVGQFARAETLYREAIAGFRKTLGPTHTETANSTAHLLSLLHRTKRYEEESELLDEALLPFDEVASEGNAGYLELLHQRGHWLHATGDPEAALAMFRSTFDAQVNSIGNPAQIEHFGNCLSYELLNQRRFEDAKLVLEQVLDRCFDVSKPGSIQQANLLDRHAHCSMQLEYFESSKISAQRSLSVRERLQPDDLVTLAGTKMLLGMSYLRLGEFGEAQELLRDVLAVREKNLGPDHWLVHNTRSVLGECLYHLDETEKAKELIKIAHEAMQSNPSAPPPRLRESEARLKMIENTDSDS